MSSMVETPEAETSPRAREDPHAPLRVWLQLLTCTALIERHAGEPIDDAHAVFAVDEYSRGEDGRGCNAGIAIAGRHVWLQHLPADQVPMCGPGLNYLLDAMPISGVIRTVLTGSGECAKVDWALLGLSMPEWSLAWFVLLALWVALTMLPSQR